MGTGILSFTTGGRSVDLMVSGGFAEVDREGITVMTEIAALGEEVDRAVEEGALTQFQKELSALGAVAETDAEFQRLNAETERAAAKLHLVK